MQEHIRWCRTHDDVAVVYDDGSVSCRWELVVETHTDDHELVDLPIVAELKADLAAATWAAENNPAVEERDRYRDAIERHRQHHYKPKHPRVPWDYELDLWAVLDPKYDPAEGVSP